MSLKAQIEAIIYAAEEPVTLDQLLSLLQQDIVAAETHTNQEEAPAPSATLSLEAAEDVDSAAPSADSAPEDAQREGEVEASDSDPLGEGELLNPKRAKREEQKRHRALVKSHVDELIREYAEADRGIEIRELAGGYRMSTKPEHHDLVVNFAKGGKPPIKLSLPALETLAVIAYKQPITAPEISEIRGVDTAGVLNSLLSRKLITTAGRKQVVGRPILYKTTKEFLLRFGLKDLNELPSMEEFEKLTSQSDIFEDSETAVQDHEEASTMMGVEAKPVHGEEQQSEGAIPEDFAEPV